MTLRRLIIRSLRYYWRTGIVVIFGLAVATAVIVGSLVIGDSVRGSIRDTAVARLGNIDHALVAPHFFRSELADDLAESPKLSGKLSGVVPLVIMGGAAESAATEAVIPNVGVIGVDDSFWRLAAEPANLRLTGRQAVVNSSLARDLDIKTGDSLLIDIDKQAAVPSGTLFAHRSPEDTMRTLRLQVVAVLPDLGIGGFRLDAGTDTPRNVFISRDWLTSQIGKEGLANALAVVSKPDAGEITADLQSALGSACSLADYGLRLVSNSEQGYISFESAGMLLQATETEAARDAAAEVGARYGLTSVYLATTIRQLKDADSSTAYSVVAAVEPPGRLQFISGGSERLDEHGIWLDAWSAQDLKARVGDRLELTYLVPQRDGSYRDAKIELTVRGIVALSGPATDRGLVPEFEGITNAERIGDWNPPFPVALGRVTERDEVYWERYRTAPKAFVSLETARAMWNGGSKDGNAPWVTSLRVAPKSGSDIAELERRFERALLRRLSAQDSGLVFRPVRRLAIASAAGTTDFGQLFMAMSFFLVLSGAGLAGMLMRLSAERRASEAGVMLACGFKPSTTVLTLFTEGVTLTLFGVLIGVPFGLLYAWGIILALKSWWIGAVGTSALWLHMIPVSLAAGALFGLLVGAVSVGWGALRLRRVNVLRLLSGWQALVGHLPRKQTLIPRPCHPELVSGSTDCEGMLNPLNQVQGQHDSVAHRTTSDPIGMRVLLAALLTAAVALALSPLAGIGISQQAAFFGSGAALLAAGITGSNLMLSRAIRLKAGAPSLVGLALRTTAANRSRSLLVITLLACAGFIIVAVAANTRDFSRIDYAERNSGTGGFALRAISSLPVRYDLGSPRGRAGLGFPPEDEKIFVGVRVIPFLVSSGEDISCLNLARPSRPRVLGVGSVMVERGGFAVLTGRTSAGDNPWLLLQETHNGAIPVFGDADSVKWTLHSGLGKTYTIPGGDGRQMKMRFAGLTSRSIFASEILMSEEYFRRSFPEIRDPRYFLFEVPRGKEERVAESLRRNLGRMGLEVRSTREVLNAYVGVQNTYLSMFTALGGLGFILGTVGLVAVMLRGALERRSEFALMLATGFSRTDLSKLLLFENVGLLIAGVAIGTVSALVAVAPQLAAVDSRINWSAICVVLISMVLVGLLSCALAAGKVARGPLIEALRGE